MDKFWMVLIWGTPSASYKHTSLESAAQEAERLLALPENRSKGAVILEAVQYGKPKPAPILWERIAD